MKKSIMIALVLLVLPLQTAIADEPNNNDDTFLLSSTTQQLAPNIYSLGSRVDPASAQMVDGLAFVTTRRTGSASGSGTNCYSIIGNGVKWKNVEPWIANMDNNSGLDPNVLLNIESASLQKWETAAGVEIFGDGMLSDATSTDTSVPDGQNEVMFGNVLVNNPEALAVTIVWGVFSGPPNDRVIVEWDKVYDETEFSWATNGDPTKMDFENISTHGNGYAAGLDSTPDSCGDESMYRFSVEGETKKRTLENGDISGINQIY